MKTCRKCGEAKPLEDFQRRSKNADGRSGMCKPCKRSYDRAHYAANPQRRRYIRANSDSRIGVVRAWIRTYLISHPCIDCGENDIVVLEFDHREDKNYSVSKLLRNGNIESVMAEVAKCDVRCANCHSRKTAIDYGSWRLS